MTADGPRPGAGRVAVDPSDAETVDAVLTTTRAVRRRLDLERPVDDETILECIDVAEQAPTGANLSSRRWIVVRDPELKQRLAEIYRRVTGGRPARPDARDEALSAVMRSARHLQEHFADVPAIVIPVILGRHDGSGRPGLFDSVIQSAWSFCLALRARGLGSAWTTAGLTRDDEIKELLGIPEDVTEIAMLPVAWTKGLEFNRAPRPPARHIAYFDGWGRTYEHGPSAPASMDDGPGAVVEIDIRASLEQVWEQISDINMPADFSQEFLGADWQDPHDGPRLGAVFTGRNRHPMRADWEARCTIDVYEEMSSFGWCTGDARTPGARWRFGLERFPGATRLRFRLILGPGPSGLTSIIERRPDLEPRIIDNRLREHRANMLRVLEGVKAALEATPS